MADLATPSAAAIATAEQKPAANVKPERPDEEQYKEALGKAEKELRAADDRMKAIKAKLDLARPNNKDSPASKRQQELRTDLQSIRTEQQSSKSGRTQIMDKIKRLDENLKSRINESKNERGKVQFKSADEVQKEIDRLQKQVDAGTMKLVDEKKALADISQLNRQKKSFAKFDESQQGIDEVKAQIAELRKSMDDPRSRELSERYTQIITELDKIKADQDEVFKNLNSLRDERTKAHEDQQKKFSTVKEIKDVYYSQRRAAVEYEREARRIREDKRRAENDAYHRGRRQEAAKSKLDDASAPAYEIEIRTTQTLLAHFDPSSVAKREIAGPGKFAASASRTVDDAGMKGTRLVRKGAEEENYFIGGASKKNKRNRSQANGAASPAAESKFNLDFGTIQSLSNINVDAPMSQSDVPAVVEKLKEKLEFWKSDQDRKTKENIEKAQAEIDRLEAEASAVDSKSRPSDKPAAEKKQQANGSTPAAAEQENGVADATEALQNTKIEDKVNGEDD